MNHSDALTLLTLDLDSSTVNPDVLSSVRPIEPKEPPVMSSSVPLVEFKSSFPPEEQEKPTVEPFSSTVHEFSFIPH